MFNRLFSRGVGGTLAEEVQLLVPTEALQAVPILWAFTLKLTMNFFTQKSVE